MGCGPLETVRPTGVPCLTGVPLPGAWARTVPAGPVLDRIVSVIGAQRHPGLVEGRLRLVQ